MVIDCHVHVPSMTYLPKQFIKGVVDNLAGALRVHSTTISSDRLAETVYTVLQDDCAENLVKDMNSAGVDKAVLLLPDFTYVFRDHEYSIEELVQKHLEILKNYPDKFFFFMGMDPRWGGDGIDLFEKTVQSGHCKGFKLYPPCGFSPSDESLFPFYEICNRYNIPVLMHVGGSSPTLSNEFANPMHIDKAAFEFKNVNFILAHGLVNFPEESTMLGRLRPNIFLDSSGYYSLEGSSRLSSFREFFADSSLHHKILFGSDWPMSILGKGYSQIIEMFTKDKQLETTIKKRNKELLFSENLMRLLPGETNEN